MKKRLNIKSKLIAGLSAAAIAVSGGAMNMFTTSVSAADLGLDNYAKLLQYSLYFYDANMCGNDVGESSAFSWRDDCHTGNVVTGGFHDAGDGIQCGLTTGFTASTMGWMYYEYKDQFDKTGTTQHYKVIMERFCKLFKDSTTLSDSGEVTSLVYEMGDDGKDHGLWQAPELMDS
ncbi:MAG: glycoside hydrolase family 9 protein, partial [Ruminococcus sp.]|nr:glycoside hydrolase family 9 protein [Ruminococcus sp.]